MLMASISRAAGSFEHRTERNPFRYFSGVLAVSSSRRSLQPIASASSHTRRQQSLHPSTSSLCIRVHPPSPHQLHSTRKDKHLEPLHRIIWPIHHASQAMQVKPALIEEANAIGISFSRRPKVNNAALNNQSSYNERGNVISCISHLARRTHPDCVCHSRRTLGSPCSLC